MQTTLNFRADRIIQAMLKVGWITVGTTLVGTGLIKTATSKPYLVSQSLVMISIFLIAVLTFLGSLVLSYWKLRREQFRLLDMNENRSGLWLNQYIFLSGQLYIPFDWLTVTKVNGGYRLNWQRALKLDRKKRPQLQPPSGIYLSNQWFDKKELTNFLTSVNYFQNGAVGPTPQMKASKTATVSKKARQIIRRQLISLVALFVIGNTVVVFDNGFRLKRTGGDDSHQKVQLKKDTTYKSRNLTFKIHHLYKATNQDDDPIMIVNMTVTPRNKHASLDADNFDTYKKWSDADEVNFRNYSEATDEIGAQVKIDGEQKPIINALDADGWYSSDYNTPLREPMNVVIRRPKAATFDLAYQGFYYEYNLPDDDDDTSIVFHVKTSDLEVLK